MADFYIPLEVKTITVGEFFTVMTEVVDSPERVTAYVMYGERRFTWEIHQYMDKKHMMRRISVNFDDILQVDFIPHVPNGKPFLISSLTIWMNKAPVFLQWCGNGDEWLPVPDFTLDVNQTEFIRSHQIEFSMGNFDDTYRLLQVLEPALMVRKAPPGFITQTDWDEHDLYEEDSAGERGAASTSTSSSTRSTGRNRSKRGRRN